MNADDPRHGTTRGYHAGCHDFCCRTAMARYEKVGRLARLRGGRAVPALGAQRRLRALMALGHSSTAIADAAGHPHRNHVLRILNGQKGKPTTWLERSTHAWVCDVYERLSMQVATGAYADRTRAYAAKRGYAPPLAWNDIDDPAEQPTDWAYIPADRATALAEMVARGDNLTTACRALKLSENGLNRWCLNNSCGDLYRTLAAREGDWNASGRYGRREAS